MTSSQSCKIVLFLLAAVNSIQLSEQITTIIVSPSCTNLAFPCLSEALRNLSTSVDLAFVLLPGTHNLGSSRSIYIRDRNSISFARTAKVTVVKCSSPRYYFNLQINNVSNVIIKDITFDGCSLKFYSSNNTKIIRSIFLNGRYGTLDFYYNCFNVSIDQSTFKNNQEYKYRSVITFYRSRGIEITRSNFTNNTITSGVIDTRYSTGFISCCNFHNNRVGTRDGIVETRGGSLIYVTNSTFTENYVSRYGGILLDSGRTSFMTVISCVFKYNTADSYGGVVNVYGPSAATILASEFSHNIAYSNGGTITFVYSNGQVHIDCTRFLNNSANNVDGSNTLTINNSPLCSSRFAFGDSGICRRSADTCDVCRPPNVNIAFEFKEYTVREGIQNDNFAFRVCVVGTDIPFFVQATMDVLNGTAKEGTDFTTQCSECRYLEFTPREGTQHQCIYIEILDDSQIEPDEQFTIKLSSENPQVTFSCDEATVKIIDTTIPTTPTTVIPIGYKTVLVECGVFRRLVNFTSNGNDTLSLKQAISQTFSGLKIEHIASLQIKSEEYQGQFIDILDPTSRIVHKSFIKATLYSQNKSSCLI